jgi:hypothetical protein
MKLKGTISGTSLIIAFAAFSLISFQRANAAGSSDSPGACEVQLFDGSHFEDGHVTVKGPGKFSSLKKLPNSSKDWNDEADSFKAGKNAVVTFWTKTNFKGQSKTYKAGAQEASIDHEPSSMKIRCSNHQ